jgi:osmotically-inducible protein OsmY
MDSQKQHMNRGPHLPIPRESLQRDLPAHYEGGVDVREQLNVAVHSPADLIERFLKVPRNRKDIANVSGITNRILVADPKTPELKLKKDVYEALLSTPAVREHAALKINVEGAVVKLHGIAADRATQEAAIRGAKSVSGVKDVINELQIGKVRHKQLELEGVGGDNTDNKQLFVP